MGLPIRLTMTAAMTGFTSMQMASVARASGQCSSKPPIWKPMPTDTKKSTAKASRMGKASLAARLANLLCPTTMPERKAPNSMEALNTVAESTAIPRAHTSTARVNNSSEQWREI